MTFVRLFCDSQTVTEPLKLKSECTNQPTNNYSLLRKIKSFLLGVVNLTKHLQAGGFRLSVFCHGSFCPRGDLKNRPSKKPTFFPKGGFLTSERLFWDF